MPLAHWTPPPEMYEFIEGELVSKTPTEAVVCAGGVGYRLRVPLSTSHGLPDGGAKVRLLVHHYVREDAQRLYGFATPTERAVFEKLMEVPKVGPSLALAVLSGVEVGELRAAILEQRPEALRRVKGVGTATAERIVRELRRDAPDLFGAEAAGASPAAADGGKARDAVSALLTLGYQRSSAEKAVRAALEALGDEADLDAVVIEAVRRA